METQQTSGTQRLTRACLALSIFLVLIILGTVTFLMAHNSAVLETVMFDTVVGDIVIGSGIYLALPLGLMDIILGSNGVRKKSLNMRKTIPLIGIIVGVLGILIGLFWWAAANGLLN